MTQAVKVFRIKALLCALAYCMGACGASNAPAPDAPAADGLDTATFDQQTSSEVAGLPIDVPENFDLSGDSAKVEAVKLLAVTPLSGPSAGGTAVTLTGTGFDGETQFIFGEKIGISPVILDEQTATVIAPGNPAGTVKIYAVNDSGTAVLKPGYTYRAAAQLSALQPALGAIAGGTLLHLSGSALLADANAGYNATLLVRLGDKSYPAKILAATGDGLQAVLPAVPQPGAYDVIFANVDGEFSAGAAYVYVGAAASGLGQSPSLRAVWPNTMPVNQLQSLTLAVTGALDAKQLAGATVLFGGKPASVQWAVPDATGGKLGATLRVVPPAAKGSVFPQSVDISIQLADSATSVAAAFTYLPAAAQITSVTPSVLDATGGNSITIAYFAGDWGQPTGVKIGALGASALQPSGSGAVKATAPAGSFGRADVTLLFGNGKSLILQGGVQFAAAQAKVVAVVAHAGAQAGGTWVSVIGSGLESLESLYFAGRIVKTAAMIDGGLLRVRTPPADEAGLVKVFAYFAQNRLQILPNGFVYFDPIGPDTGTWGEHIDGAVNVTVLRQDSHKAIAGVTVMLGENLSTSLQGKTDERGQVTLSAPKLSGPLALHVNKIMHTAASIVGFDAQNVTLQLAADVVLPQEAGAGEGGDKNPPQINDALLTGSVIDADKYVNFPPGNCANHAVVKGNCAVCLSDSECGNGTTCEILGPGPVAVGADGTPLPGEATGIWAVTKYCAADCASDAVCADGFECRNISKDSNIKTMRCSPLIGVPQVRCESASPNLLGGSAVDQNQGIVGADHQFSVPAKAGDQAVMCRAGYFNAMTAEFVPLAIGVLRPLTAYAGKKITGLKVAITTPLNRRLRVRMDGIPTGSDAEGARSIAVGLKIGAAGYFPMGSIATNLHTDVLELERQPAATFFLGNNADLRYDLVGGVSNNNGGAPLSQAQAIGQNVTSFDSWLQLKAPAPQPLEGNQAAGTLHAMAQRDNARIAVGENGRISLWTGDTLSQQPSPTNKNLTAIWLPSDSGSDGWIGSEDGQLLRRNALGWQVQGLSLGVGVRSMSGRSASDGWLVDFDNQMHHWNGQQWTTVAGPLGKPPFPSGKPGQYVGAFPRVRALWHAPDGAIFAACDNGQLFRGGLQANGGLNYTEIKTGASADLRAVNGTSASDFWLAGDRGFVGHCDGKAVTSVATGTVRPLYAISQPDVAQTVHIVGAQGTWLQVSAQMQVSDRSALGSHLDLRGVATLLDGSQLAVGEPILPMGPYLQMPYPLVPATFGKFEHNIEWAVADGNKPSFQRIAVEDAVFQTRWEILAHGSLNALSLPDFTKMLGIAPLHGVSARVRIWRVYAPGCELDAFAAKCLQPPVWTSWAYNLVTASVSPVTLDTAMPWDAGGFGK